jgi:hypothetical protein
MKIQRPRDNLEISKRKLVYHVPRITADFTLERMEARRQWDDRSKSLKKMGKKSIKILYSAKLSKIKMKVK